ncbi:MAG: Fe-S cluster assembly ATPase SufC [Candidatus Micrarchaeota archaeon]
MLTIKDLKVSIESKELIRDFSLSINDGEIHAIMGPNGAGKSTLAKALAGHPSLKVSGSIKIDSEELVNEPADVRSRKGLFLAFQNPEEVEGVKVSSLIRKAIAAREGPANDMDRMVAIHEELCAYAKELGLDESFISRELNVGFSGGEKKRAEAIQMMALKPKVVILDEIDSGLDVDGIKLISKMISRMRDGKRCFLIITHYPRILKFVKPDRVHILSGGRITRSGTESLAHEIEEKGYAKKPEGGADA